MCINDTFESLSKLSLQISRPSAELDNTPLHMALAYLALRHRPVDMDLCLHASDTGQAVGLAFGC